MSLKNKKLLGGVLVILLGAGAGLLVFLNKRITKKEISSFEECVEAGYPILESYPPQCIAPGGRAFTGKLSEQKSKKIKTYSDPDEVIEIQKGEKFQIAFVSNPTTGYGWEVTADTNFVSLVDQKFEPESDLIGAGGTETFEFSALNTRETEIIFSYKRSWEKEIIEKKVFKVKIL